MKKHLLIPILALFSLQVFAQTLSYEFTVQSGTYTELPESAISANNGSTWDDPDWEIPLGFDFDYMGFSFNTLFFSGIDSYGGELLFGTPATGPIFQGIMPYMQDLMDGGDDDGSASDSPVSYLTEGTPGTRIFKLEWKNAAFYNDEIESTMRMNLQLWLYEGLNMIEYHYGPNENLVNAVIQDYDGIVVGLYQDFDTNVYTFTGIWTLGGDPMTPTVNYYYTYDEFVAGAHLTSTPSNGTIYRFFDPALAVQEEAQPSTAFDVFPTEVSDFVFASWGGKNTALMTISDMSGRVVKTQMITEGTQTISASELAGGVYIVSVRTGNEYFQERIVKQ